MVTLHAILLHKLTPELGFLVPRVTAGTLDVVWLCCEQVSVPLPRPHGLRTVLLQTQLSLKVFKIKVRNSCILTWSFLKIPKCCC